jgi:hypothetical protein
VVRGIDRPVDRPKVELDVSVALGMTAVLILDRFVVAVGVGFFAFVFVLLVFLREFSLESVQPLSDVGVSTTLTRGCPPNINSPIAPTAHIIREQA